MKSNKKFRSLKTNNSGFTQVVGGLVALLLMIIVGVLIFWEVSDSITLTGNASND